MDFNFWFGILAGLLLQHTMSSQQSKNRLKKVNFNLSVISVVSGAHMMVGLPWSRLIDPYYCIQSLIALGCAPLITWFTSRYILNKIFSEFGQQCTSENPHKDRPPVTRFEVLSIVVGLALGLSIQTVDESLQLFVYPGIAGALICSGSQITHKGLPST